MNLYLHPSTSGAQVTACETKIFLITYSPNFLPVV